MKKIEGLGDLIKTSLEVTGLNKLASSTCKCEERRKKLNAYFPFPKIPSKKKRY